MHMLAASWIECSIRSQSEFCFMQGDTNWSWHLAIHQDADASISAASRKPSWRVDICCIHQGPLAPQRELHNEKIKHEIGWLYWVMSLAIPHRIQSTYLYQWPQGLDSLVGKALLVLAQMSGLSTDDVIRSCHGIGQSWPPTHFGWLWTNGRLIQSGPTIKNMEGCCLMPASLNIDAALNLNVEYIYHWRARLARAVSTLSL